MNRERSITNLRWKVCGKYLDFLLTGHRTVTLENIKSCHMLFSSFWYSVFQMHKGQWPWVFTLYTTMVYIILPFSLSCKTFYLSKVINKPNLHSKFWLEIVENSSDSNLKTDSGIWYNERYDPISKLKKSANVQKMYINILR